MAFLVDAQFLCAQRDGHRTGRSSAFVLLLRRLSLDNSWKPVLIHRDLAPEYLLLRIKHSEEWIEDLAPTPCPSSSDTQDVVTVVNVVAGLLGLSCDGTEDLPEDQSLPLDTRRRSHLVGAAVLWLDLKRFGRSRQQRYRLARTGSGSRSDPRLWPQMKAFSRARQANATCVSALATGLGLWSVLRGCYQLFGANSEAISSRG